MVNCTIKARPRRAFGKRPPAPTKPKGEPGRPFVGARGGGRGGGPIYDYPIYYYSIHHHHLLLFIILGSSWKRRFTQIFPKTTYVPMVALALAPVWPGIANSRISALPNAHLRSQGARPSLLCRVLNVEFFVKN